jgi:hypothetical protein
MMNQLLAAALLAVGTAASGQTVLYDTFNEADQANLFDCCNALSFGGPHAHERVLIAIPFTVPVKSHIIEIDIPLSHVDGDRTNVSVALSGDHGHKKTFHVTGLVPGGQCCTFVAIDGEGVAVAPGGHYRLKLRAAQQATDAWNLNSAGIIGSYQTSNDNGATWTPVEGTLPAVRIIGR